MRTAAAVMALLLAASLSAQTAPLDQYLTARTELGQFSGSVLVAHEGKVLLRKGYGYANLEHLVANAPETKFEIASLTKAFTALAVQMLAAEGKLKLDAPMCTYFEPCAEAWKPITVAQLVHHTSGIPDYEAALEMGSQSYYASLMRDDSAASSIEWARAKPLDFEPGTKFKYSNTAYLILGLILERAAGKPYEELLRERIFTPLKMTSTMHIDRTRPQLRRADAYTHQAPLIEAIAGFPLTSPHLRRVPALRQSPPQADGGLLSTIDDMHLWARALLGDGPFGEQLRAAAFRANEPGSYALGWFVGKRFDRTLYSHTGVLPGMVSVVHIYPESRTIVIVLCNLDRARLSNIARDLMHIVLLRPYDVPHPHRTTTIDAQAAKRFEGDYKLADGRLMTIRHDAKNGWLEAEVKGQFIAGLLAESERVFYAPMWEGTISFEADAGALVMHQTGVDQRGERTP